MQIYCVLFLVILRCASNGTDPEAEGERDYRQDMRAFVLEISARSKAVNPDFVVIPQNGHELLTETGESNGPEASDYIQGIDGVGREDLFYGYDEDNEPTPASEREHMLDFMYLAEDNGIEVLVTDYCWTPAYVDDSYAQNAERDYISFAADHRELDNIPSYPGVPFSANTNDIFSLYDARNFLYLINPSEYDSKTAFLEAIRGTDFDVVLIDPFFAEGEALESADVSSLKRKANGGARMVIAYMSIGEAEEYRYYWKGEWEDNSPAWLAEENPDWPGNYKVRYWDPAWQSIIYGNDDSYLTRILGAVFDGVYLDIIDAYEFFED